LGVSAKGPGGFVAIGADGITIQGVLVRINAGGEPGSSSAAKPGEALKARELKQPLPADVVEDMRSDADVSGLLKSLAAMATLARAKPTAAGKRWERSVTFEGKKVFQRDDL